MPFINTFKGDTFIDPEELFEFIYEEIKDEIDTCLHHACDIDMMWAHYRKLKNILDFLCSKYTDEFDLLPFYVKRPLLYIDRLYNEIDKYEAEKNNSKKFSK